MSKAEKNIKHTKKCKNIPYMNEHLTSNIEGHRSVENPDEAKILLEGRKRETFTLKKGKNGDVQLISKPIIIINSSKYLTEKEITFILTAKGNTKGYKKFITNLLETKKVKLVINEKIQYQPIFSSMSDVWEEIYKVIDLPHWIIKKYMNKEISLEEIKKLLNLKHRDIVKNIILKNDIEIIDFKQASKLRRNREMEKIEKIEITPDDVEKLKQREIFLPDLEEKYGTTRWYIKKALKEDYGIEESFWFYEIELTDKETDEYNKGNISKRKLARIHGTHPEKIKKILSNKKIKIRKTSEVKYKEKKIINLTKEEVELAIKRELTINDLANRYGTTNKKIWEALKRQGVAKKDIIGYKGTKTGRSSFKLSSEMLKHHKKGCSIRILAEVYNTTPTTFLKALRKDKKVKLRSPSEGLEAMMNLVPKIYIERLNKDEDPDHLSKELDIPRLAFDKSVALQTEEWRIWEEFCEVMIELTYKNFKIKPNYPWGIPDCEIKRGNIIIDFKSNGKELGNTLIKYAGKCKILQIWCLTNTPKSTFPPEIDPITQERTEIIFKSAYKVINEIKNEKEKNNMKKLFLMKFKTHTDILDHIE